MDISSIGTETRQVQPTEHDTSMDREDFTKILVTQLRHQDPMNPMDDKEFIVQMTQFSQLEQLYNMSSSYDRSNAISLLGMEVTALNDDGDEITGIVTGINSMKGTPNVEIDGKNIPVTDVIEARSADSNEHNEESEGGYV